MGDQHQQRVEVHCDETRTIEFPVNVIGKTARTGTEHQHVAQPGVVMQDRANLL
jgi:hypothetical protein